MLKARTIPLTQYTTNLRYFNRVETAVNFNHTGRAGQTPHSSPHSLGQANICTADWSRGPSQSWKKSASSTVVHDTSWAGHPVYRAPRREIPHVRDTDLRTNRAGSREIQQECLRGCLETKSLKKKII